MYLAQYNATNTAINNYVEVDPKCTTSKIFLESFTELKRRGIIVNDSYEEGRWTLTDRFEKSSIFFNRAMFSPNGYSKENYIFFLKNIVLGQICNGRHYAGVCDAINSIIDISNQTKGFRCPIEHVVNASVAATLEEVLNELNIDMTFEYEDKKSNRRELRAQEEYYRFELRLSTFWADASIEEKVLFFPLYLFWFLCNIIPTRPKEFCLIPYDCILHEKEQIFIKLPKSSIKGGKRVVANNVDTYPLVLFQFPKELAIKIEEYKKYTSGYDSGLPNSRRRLFNRVSINDTYRSKTSRLDFRLDDLYFLIDKFYEVYSEKYTTFNPDSIIKWKPGDLRHLALINMIEMGVDPMVCMYFAGHVDMTTCLHYGRNINSFTQYRINQMDEIKPVEEETNRELSLHNNWIKVPGGLCTNNLGQNNNWQCANYPNEYGCPYFVSDGAVARIESNRKDLWQHFCELYKKKEYNSAKKILIEFQRETVIYEDMINGTK